MNTIPTNGKSSSVLVVDDEPGMRTALQANFQRHGWRVETATGVADATRLLEHTRLRLSDQTNIL
jgi:DNA-binding NtrC family response regulator